MCAHTSHSNINNFHECECEIEAYLEPTKKCISVDLDFFHPNCMRMIRAHKHTTLLFILFFSTFRVLFVRIIARNAAMHISLAFKSFKVIVKLFSIPFFFRLIQEWLSAPWLNMNIFCIVWNFGEYLSSSSMMITAPSLCVLLGSRAIIFLANWLWARYPGNVPFPQNLQNQ